MQVTLKRNWFDPSGTLREVSRNPHQLPDTWKDVLPSDAEAVEDPAPVVEKPLVKTPAAPAKKEEPKKEDQKKLDLEVE